MSPEQKETLRFHMGEIEKVFPDCAIYLVLHLTDNGNFDLITNTVGEPIKLLHDLLCGSTNKGKEFLDARAHN